MSIFSFMSISVTQCVRGLDGHASLLRPCAGANQADLADVRMNAKPRSQRAGDRQHLFFADARALRRAQTLLAAPKPQHEPPQRPLFAVGADSPPPIEANWLQPGDAMRKTRELGLHLLQSCAQIDGFL